MAVVTFTEAARLLGHRSRNQLYRARDDGRLAGYLAEGGIELEPPGLPPLAVHLRNVTRCHAKPAGRSGPVRAIAGPAADGVPPYDDSRARTEWERANLLEMERKVKEGELLERAQVEQVWANILVLTRNKLLSLPTRYRQQVPHLSLDEVAVLDDLIRESLENLADGGA